MLDFSVTFLITLVNLGVLYLALRKLLFKRLGDFMRARSEGVRRELSEASSTKKRAEDLQARYEELLANAENEGEWVLRDAEERAEEESRELLEAAKAEAEDIRSRAEAAGAREASRARELLEAEIARLAAAAAARLVGREAAAADERAAAVILAELEAPRG